MGGEVGSQQSIAVIMRCAMVARENAQIPFQM